MRASILLMSAPPPLFDPNLRDLRRARAARIGPELFLAAEAAAHVAERLEEINRTFPDRCIVAPSPEPWHQNGIEGRWIPDDDVLDLEPDSLDLIVHGLSLHAANDPVGQLVQCRRALRKDGLCLAVMFGGQTLHELRASLAQAEADLRGGLSPRVHPMGDIRELGALLQRTGFALPVSDSFNLTVTYSSPLALMAELRAMGETNAMAAQSRSFMRRDVLHAACAHYVSAFGTPDGRVPATFELVFLTGWAPDATQQKPLRPGSASARLADALGTTEKSAGEKPT